MIDPGTSGTDEREIYLDNAATTRPDPRVVEAMLPFVRDEFGNPSSVHRRGVEAARAIARARAVFARAFRCDAAGVVFTSGGTEADALAILGFGRRGERVVISAVEHPAVAKSAEALRATGIAVEVVPVDSRGLVDPDRVASLVTPRTSLVSVIHVQNEIGTIEPVAEIARAVKARCERTIVHVDAVQAFTRVPFPRDAPIDAVSISSHKIHGPMGVGALVCLGTRRPDPIVFGGGQEGGVRAGTENVPGIVGFARAAEIALDEMDVAGARMARQREMLWAIIQAGLPGATMNGAAADARAPHNLSVSLDSVPGEVIVHALEAEGVFVSTGSACHSRATDISPVLKAIGKRAGRVEATIRFSLSRNTSDEDIARAGAAFVRVVRAQRAVMVR